jgi:PIN domain nuclease of toxin-antitoxin system
LRLLVDTHAFLWFVTDDPRLSATAKALMEREDSELLLSPASHWEMAIKISAGKLSLAEPFQILVPREILLNDIQILPIEVGHSAVVAALPYHHRDPFDRMLISQATVEGIPLISADTQFDAYGVTRLW